MNNQMRYLIGSAIMAVAVANAACASGAVQESGVDGPAVVRGPGLEGPTAGATPAHAPTKAVRARYPLIPWPRQLEPGEGEFALDADTRMVLAPDIGVRIRRAVERFAQRMRVEAGFTLPVVDSAASANVILISLDSALEALGPDGYRLKITPGRVTLAAPVEAGLFHGLQTLRQLLPARIEQPGQSVEVAVPAMRAANPAGGSDGADTANGGSAMRRMTLPAVEIRDAPRFAYRGMHLDVGRHFFPVEFIKKYIDLLAFYKFNRFHWHLTEDQGWRLEIERYPRLTQVGACREETQLAKYHDDPFIGDGERYCGYYTQEQAREIVAYARDRFITVIPEIEMPGHSLAALTAYPELACTEGPFEVGTRWGVYEEIYCPSERTFAFLEGVLTEVLDIFPSEYIHIGGDEAPKARWESSEVAQAVMASEGLETEEALQSWFIARIGRFLAAHGRRVIGWDEILEGGLPEGATVMSWRGIEGGIEAARQGADVVMTPTSHLYFDYFQGDPEQEPLAIGGYTPLREVYAFDPVPDVLAPEEAEHILGAQANVWTEYITNPRKVEYMAYPRALALAEVVWSPTEVRHWEGFRDRLGPHLERLDSLDVNYRLPDVTGLAEDRVVAGESVAVTLGHPVEGADIRFTLNGSEPTRESPSYIGPIKLRLPEPLRFGPEDGRVAPVGITVKARAYLPDGRVTDVVSAEFVRAVRGARAVEPHAPRSG